MSDKTPLVILADKGLEKAVSVLRAGGILAYPTETFYGLAVDPKNPRAVKRLIKLKGRPEGKAIPLIAGDMSCVHTLIRGQISPVGQRLMDSFWPGPLTLIFQSAASLSPLITGEDRGIGIRISDYPFCQKLLKATGFPLTSTSANPASKQPAREPREVHGYFNGNIDLIIDGGRTPGSMASTVVDVRGERPVILREGLIKGSEILKAAK